MHVAVKYPCLLVLMLPLSGCVVWDIRDSMKRIEADLKTVDEVNQQLVDLQVKLERLESIDGSLKSIDADLKTVKVSLGRLDEHLASLRRTLKTLDSNIPFFNLADDEEVTDAPPPEPPPEQLPEPPVTPGQGAQDPPAGQAGGRTAVPSF